MPGLSDWANTTADKQMLHIQQNSKAENFWRPQLGRWVLVRKALLKR
jgi:hypothetical protein